MPLPDAMDAPGSPRAGLPVRAVPAGPPLALAGPGLGRPDALPLPGLVHGLAAALFGAALMLLAGQRFWALAGSFSGFLLVRRWWPQAFTPSAAR